MRKLWPGIAAILASVVFSVAMFNRLPERVVSHWGANGVANGWSSRFSLVFGIHVVLIAVAAVLAYAPSISPQRNNFKLHESSYWLVANASLVLVSACTIIAVGMNLGWKLHMGWIGFGLGLLFITIGNVMTRVRPNWILGARTPWTLSSDKSWRETNRITGYGFVILGIANIFVTAIRPTAMVWVMLGGSSQFPLFQWWSATLSGKTIHLHDTIDTEKMLTHFKRAL